MSTPSFAALSVAFVAVLSAGTGAAAEPLQSPGLGKPAAPEVVAKWNTSVFADGTGLPPGSGTATIGRPIFAAKCAHCHGPDGVGASAEELAGAQHGLRDHEPDKVVGTYWPYASTLFDFIRRAMPLDTPASLSDDEVYAVTAYVLFLNGVIVPDEVMNAATLAQVRLPNRDGFIREDRQWTDDR